MICEHYMTQPLKGDEVPRCVVCQEIWPCPTIRQVWAARRAEAPER